LNSKQKIACIITGIPRPGFSRCIKTLKFLLSEEDVDYYAIAREEFLVTPNVLDELRFCIPNIQIISVPQGSQNGITCTVKKMWHEINYGYNMIRKLGINYSSVFKTRFDVYFSPQFLPILDTNENTILIPDQLSWSGSNDMVCLGTAESFGKYADTYESLQDINSLVNKRQSKAPEQILSTVLHDTQINQQNLPISYILYRSEIFDSLSSETLDALCTISPELSIYKIGLEYDSPKSRLDVKRKVIETTREETLYPLQLIPHSGNVYPPEIDKRDNTTFRFMNLHMHLRIAIQKNTNKVRFKIHYMPDSYRRFRAGDSLNSMLGMTVDNYPVDLYAIDIDEYGRLLVEGSLDECNFKRPLSKVGICSMGSVVPSEIYPASIDNRLISIAIGHIYFISDDT
jgi:hypothetical protein